MRRHGVPAEILTDNGSQYVSNVPDAGDWNQLPIHISRNLCPVPVTSTNPGQLHSRLSKLASIDVAQIPPDKVGLGSRVVVEDEKSRDREEYHLVFGDAVEFEEGHVTMSSPIGRTLLGKKVGEVAEIEAHREKLGADGLAAKRADQQLEFTWALVRDELEQRLRHSTHVAAARDEISRAVKAGEINAPEAADRILAAYDED